MNSRPESNFHSMQVYLLKENEKLQNLQQELEAVNEKRVIVFVNTKKSCDTVSRHLDVLEYHCTVLHGGKTQVHFCAINSSFTFPSLLIPDKLVNSMPILSSSSRYAEGFVEGGHVI